MTILQGFRTNWYKLTFSVCSSTAFGKKLYCSGPKKILFPFSCSFYDGLHFFIGNNRHSLPKRIIIMYTLKIVSTSNFGIIRELQKLQKHFFLYLFRIFKKKL